MATITENSTEWTLADLAAKFGPMPFGRIRQDPRPGEATEEDVEAIYSATKRLFELVDGILVEKTVGTEESFLAGWIATLLNNFILPRKLGYALVTDGIIRLNPDLVRIPDVSFLSRHRLPDGRLPRAAICPIIPDLAIEILSPSNTKKEMDEKLVDYFAAGVLLVWYVDPRKKTVRVFTSPEDFVLIRRKEHWTAEKFYQGLSCRFASCSPNLGKAAPTKDLGSVGTSLRDCWPHDRAA